MNLKIGLALGLILCGQAFAQVSVEMVLEQEQFLPREDLNVAVRVTNFSGQPLQLGRDNDWLKFAVESAEGGVVDRFGEVPVQAPFEVQSGQVGIRRVNLAPYFNLSRPGRYLLQVTVETAEIGKAISSKPAHFDIVAGTKLWEQVVGIPRSAGETNAVAQSRKYTLQQANYLKSMRLYLRVSDAADAQVYRVFPIGPMVSFSRPEVQIDRQSRLHILYQTGAKAFLYAVVGPEGDLRVRQTHEIAANRPKLALDSGGEIRVSGGVRRVTLGDLPGVAPDATPTNAPPAKAEPPQAGADKASAR